MPSVNNLFATGQCLTLDTPAYQRDVALCREGTGTFDAADLVYAAAMQRELEEIQEALDEISQYVIY